MAEFDQPHDYLLHLASGQAKTILTDGDGSVVRGDDGEPITVVDHRACLPAALFWIKANQHLSKRPYATSDSPRVIAQRKRRAEAYDYVMALAHGRGQTVLRRKDGMIERDRDGNPVFVVDHKSCGAAAIWWLKYHDGWKEELHPTTVVDIDALREAIGQIIAEGMAAAFSGASPLRSVETLLGERAMVPPR
jgi:hypothetical protein